MILNEVNFFSETLGLLSSMYVLLPKRTLPDIRNKPRKKLRTLYLLHGHSDDHTAWQRYTSIERYAEDLNIAVVMPAVHLSYYNDMAHGGRQWRFISLCQPWLQGTIGQKPNTVNQGMRRQK